MVLCDLIKAFDSVLFGSLFITQTIILWYSEYCISLKLTQSYLSKFLGLFLFTVCINDLAVP